VSSWQPADQAVNSQPLADSTRSSLIVQSIVVNVGADCYLASKFGRLPTLKDDVILLERSTEAQGLVRPV
jgi:hypothetical protein